METGSSASPAAPRRPRRWLAACVAAVVLGQLHSQCAWASGPARGAANLPAQGGKALVRRRSLPRRRLLSEASLLGSSALAAEVAIGGSEPAEAKIDPSFVHNLRPSGVNETVRFSFDIPLKLSTPTTGSWTGVSDEDGREAGSFYKIRLVKKEPRAVVRAFLIDDVQQWKDVQRLSDTDDPDVFDSTVAERVLPDGTFEWEYYTVEKVRREKWKYHNWVKIIDVRPDTKGFAKALMLVALPEKQVEAYPEIPRIRDSFVKGSGVLRDDAVQYTVEPLGIPGQRVTYTTYR